MQKSKYWLHYFTVLQVISMTATLYQNLAFGEILGRFGASAQVFGITGAMSILAMVMGLPFGGYLVDKIGGTKTFLLAQKCSFTANIIGVGLYFMDMPLAYWVSFQIIYGLVASIEISSRQHFIFENMDSKGDRGLSSVSFEVSLNGIAKIIGYTLGAKLLEHSNPMWAFAINALTYLMMGVWVHKNLDRYNHKTIGLVAHKFSFPMKTVWLDLKLRKILLYETIFSFTLYAINTQAYLLVKTLNTSYNFGWLFVSASIGNFLVNVFYTRSNGKFFKRNAILFSMLALIGLFLLILHTNFWICVAGVFFTGASLTNFSIITRSYLHRHITSSNKGAILSLYQVNWNFWTAIGTLVFGTIVQFLGFTIGFMILFTLMVLFLATFLYLNNKEKNSLSHIYNR